MYARIEEGAVAAYPVDPRVEQPNTSFPWDWIGGVVGDVEYARVVPVDVPQVDYTKNFVEGLPILLGSVWTQTWDVTDASAEEIASRLSEIRSRMTVSPLQIRRALLRSNLLDGVTTFVEQADLETRMAWEYAVQINRSDILIAAAAASVGVSEMEVDDLFHLAATL
jgi:hypothetical protein